MSQSANAVRFALLTRFLKGEAKVPQMPEAALRIRRLLEDPRTSLEQLARVINSDPPLAAYLMQFADSPLLRGGRQGMSMRDLLARLGTRQLNDLVLGFTVRHLFASRAQYDPMEVRPDGAPAHPWGHSAHPDLLLVGHEVNQKTGKPRTELVIEQVRAISDKLGLTAPAAFDVSAACAGFCYGVGLAESMVRAGSATNGPSGRSATATPMRNRPPPSLAGK